MRRADAQIAQLRGGAAPVELPQRRCLTVDVAGRQPVLDPGERPVLQFVDLLQAANRLAPARTAQAGNPPADGIGEGQPETDEDDQMQPAIQIGQQAQQRDDQEGGDDAERRPQAEPDPLPPDGQARAIDTEARVTASGGRLLDCGLELSITRSVDPWP